MACIILPSLRFAVNPQGLMDPHAQNSQVPGQAGSAQGVWKENTVEQAETPSSPFSDFTGRENEAQTEEGLVWSHRQSPDLPTSLS